MTTRHEFLAQLHELLKPRTYLEVGVQLGTSLQLAHAAELAIGIDPAPLVVEQGNQALYSMTADDFFERRSDVLEAPQRLIDLAFIDGSHLFEDALRDFMNIERYAHAGTVVVFDDVLPYAASIAGREIIAGDWTGDAWKVEPILREARPWLYQRLVDVSPTGALVIWGFGESDRPGIDLLPATYPTIVQHYIDQPVPDYVISRSLAVQPSAVLAELEMRVSQ